MKIVTVSQMQQAERDSGMFGISLDMLMENAGKAVAEETRKIVGDLRHQNILILVGPGNNGGDGLVATRHLYDWGAGRIKVYLCGKRPAQDPHLEEIKQRGVHYREIENDANLSKYSEWLSEATAVVDAVFGTGKVRPISGLLARVLTSLSSAKQERRGLRLIAVDLPSGLDANTGAVDPVTPQFDYTVTLGFPKAGLFNLPGAEKCGRISVVNIGIPEQVAENISLELLTDAWARSVLPVRPLVSHKGSFGRVMVVAGSINYLGAAYLACSGANRSGAGLTTLAIAHSLQAALAARLTETTYLPFPELPGGIAPTESVKLLRSQLPQYDVLLVGCGLGQNQRTVDMVTSLLLETQGKLPPTVLDADGINILAKTADWEKRWQEDAVMTPHAGEISRLLNRPTSEIMGDRINIARESAAKWHKTVVLKGAYTVIAAPDGRAAVSPFANAGLASAGTGDVLAGVIAGLLAQGLSMFNAAACGVFLHGLAGEMVKSDLGDAGMVASDLLPIIPKAIKKLKSDL